MSSTWYDNTTTLRFGTITTAIGVFFARILARYLELDLISTLLLVGFSGWLSYHSITRILIGIELLAASYYDEWGHYFFTFLRVNASPKTFEAFTQRKILKERRISEEKREYSTEVSFDSVSKRRYSTSKPSEGFLSFFYNLGSSAAANANTLVPPTGSFAKVTEVDINKIILDIPSERVREKIKLGRDRIDLDVVDALHSISGLDMPDSNKTTVRQMIANRPEVAKEYLAMTHDFEANPSKAIDKLLNKHAYPTIKLPGLTFNPEQVQTIANKLSTNPAVARVVVLGTLGSGLYQIYGGSTEMQNHFAVSLERVVDRSPRDHDNYDN